MKGPVILDLDAEEAKATPAEAPPVPEAAEVPTPKGQAMQTAAVLAARTGSPLGRWFWRLLAAVLAFFVSVATWRAVAALLEANPLLGIVAAVLVGAFVVVCLALAARELSALSRLGRIDALHRRAEAARDAGDLGAARAVVGDLIRLYAGRADT
ncbi:MAG: hypothetical protein ACU0CO_00085 [Shimia sp.]